MMVRTTVMVFLIGDNVNGPSTEGDLQTIGV